MAIEAGVLGHDAVDMHYKNRKFVMGEVRVTRRVTASCSPLEAQSCFLRHVSGDWGDDLVSPRDRVSNEWDLRSGGPLLSLYRLTGDRKIYVLTEGDRSKTLMFNEEDLKDFETEEFNPGGKELT